jgi:RNA polymerase sigma factor (sigma-70 family)
LSDIDHDLLARCLKKEVAAEYRLYHRFAPRVYGICLRYGGNVMEADEILQKGFIRLFSSLDQFRFDGSFEAWVTRIFVNTAINAYRQNMKFAREVEYEDSVEDPGNREDALATLSVKDLLAMIQRLPPGYRTVFNLYVIEQYNHREIAEMLGISESGSKSQLHRAKQMIRRMLQETQ